MFKDGRTETIRPCTKEVIEVAKMMETVSVKTCNNPVQAFFCGPSCDFIFKLDLESIESCIEFTKAVKKAIRAHNNQTKDCLGGQGWDRHIFGMKTQGKYFNNSFFRLTSGELPFVLTNLNYN